MKAKLLGSTGLQLQQPNFGLSLRYAGMRLWTLKDEMEWIQSIIPAPSSRAETESERRHKAARGPNKRYRSSTNRHKVDFDRPMNVSYNERRAFTRVRTRWCRDNCTANWTGTDRGYVAFDSLTDATLFTVEFDGKLTVASWTVIATDGKTMAG